MPVGPVVAAADAERVAEQEIAPCPRRKMDADRGADGTRDPGMEARVTWVEDQFARVEALLRGIDERTRRLEADGAEFRSLLRGIDERVRRVEIDLAENKGRLVNLPTTWAMITTVIGGQITLAGLVLIILKALAAR